MVQFYFFKISFQNISKFIYSHMAQGAFCELLRVCCSFVDSFLNLAQRPTTILSHCVESRDRVILVFSLLRYSRYFDDVVY